MARDNTHEIDLDQFQEISGALIKFEKDNDRYVGTLNRISEIKVQGKPVQRMHVTDIEGKAGLILMTDQMESTISDEHVGKRIRITRISTESRPGGRVMFNFKIDVAG